MKLKAMALTGGMGSGKSTVRELFSKLGYKCIDADEITAALFVSNHNQFLQIANAIDKWLGTDFSSKEFIDKNILRPLLKKNENGFHKIFELMSPYMRKEIESFINLNPWCIVEGALMVESGFSEQFECVTIVDCSKQTQIKRIKVRNPSLDEATICQMINAQTSRRNRLWHANYIIENDENTDLNDLSIQVSDVAKAYEKLIKKSSN